MMNNVIEEMYPAKKCCFCLSLRTGCIFIALFGVLFAGLNIDLIISILNDSPVFETKYLFTEELTGAFQLAAEFLLMLASIILLISTMIKSSCFVLVYVVMAVLQVVYLIVYSIVSSIMGINIVTNVSPNVCIAYWIWLFCYSCVSAYFIFIAISYYKLKQAADEDQTLP